MDVRFRRYRRKGVTEMRPYVPGEDLSRVSISEADDPKPGDMIARNPDNHDDVWLVSREWFDQNYEPVPSENEPRVIIWAGGKGTRLQEETKGLIPKPMVEIGGKPMIQHIMEMFADQGFRFFYVLSGFLGDQIESWALDTAQKGYEFADAVQVVPTGEETQTGGRLKRLAESELSKWRDGPMIATYGDGLGDINFAALLDHHSKMREKHGVIVTLTAVQPPARFGALEISGGLVRDFSEKIALDKAWVNGGFYVIERPALDYVIGDRSQWERDVLPILAHQDRLACYQHPGWWHMCDTPRDLKHLQELVESEQRPWRRWRSAREESW